MLLHFKNLNKKQEFKKKGNKAPYPINIKYVALCIQ